MCDQRADGFLGDPQGLALDGRVRDHRCSRPRERSVAQRASDHGGCLGRQVQCVHHQALCRTTVATGESGCIGAGHPHIRSAGHVGTASGEYEPAIGQHVQVPCLVLEHIPVSPREQGVSVQVGADQQGILDVRALSLDPSAGREAVAEGDYGDQPIPIERGAIGSRPEQVPIGVQTHERAVPIPISAKNEATIGRLRSIEGQAAQKATAIGPRPQGVTRPVQPDGQHVARSQVVEAARVAHDQGPSVRGRGHTIRFLGEGVRPGADPDHRAIGPVDTGHTAQQQVGRSGLM